MKTTEPLIIEKGNAAVIFSKNSKSIILESGNIYQQYGKPADKKVKLIGSGKAPDFMQCDEAYFQKRYKYLGEVNIIKDKRTLKITH